MPDIESVKYTDNIKIVVDKFNVMTEHFNNEFKDIDGGMFKDTSHEMIIDGGVF